ncbi:protein belonging to Uncharacterized protein family UPF0005, partial [Candidatus Thiomargarita nelsonii]
MALFDKMNKNVSLERNQGTQSIPFGNQDEQVFEQPLSSTEANKLIRNTYILLSMTLLFTAFTAGIAMVTRMAPMHFVVVLVGYFGLLFLTSKLQNSVWG